MTIEHGLFIPDLEYLIDCQGLIKYLAEKVSVGNLCLWCNGKGKAFHSMEAVQQHMVTFSISSHDASCKKAIVKFGMKEMKQHMRLSMTSAKIMEPKEIKMKKLSLKGTQTSAFNAAKVLCAFLRMDTNCFLTTAKLLGTDPLLSTTSRSLKLQSEMPS